MFPIEREINTNKKKTGRTQINRLSYGVHIPRMNEMPICFSFVRNFHKKSFESCFSAIYENLNVNWHNHNGPERRIKKKNFNTHR